MSNVSVDDTTFNFLRVKQKLALSANWCMQETFTSETKRSKVCEGHRKTIVNTP